jgi:hypothetical protein
MIGVPHRAPTIQWFHKKSSSVVKKTDDLTYFAINTLGIKKIAEHVDAGELRPLIHAHHLHLVTQRHDRFGKQSFALSKPPHFANNVDPC